MTTPMVDGNGNGNGRPPAAPVKTGLDPFELAALKSPARLARALAGADGNLYTAMRDLKAAGYPVSITRPGNDEPDDGNYAAHPVNVPDAGWSYSANGSRGHEECCALRRRGLYQGGRYAGDLPYAWSRVMTRDGRVFIASFVMSKTPAGPRAVITWDAIEKGTWARRLGITQSGSPRIREAVRTVLLELGYDENLEEQPAALTPGTRTPDGRIPAPAWEIMPPGYGDQPAGPDSDRLAARAVQADIAARSPNVALVLGASLAGPFAAAARVQSCLFELVAGAGAGKTTTVQFGAAVWGDPALPPESGILASWDASTKGMGRWGGALGTLPLFADESGTADFAPVEWARFTYGQTQGASRMTSSMDGEVKRTPGWSSFMFMSGNSSITEGVRSGKFAGIPRRVITLTGPFTLSAADCKRLAAAVRADYGYLGPAALESVTVAQFERWAAEALEVFGPQPGPALATNAEQLAAAVAGARAADLIMGTGTRISDAAMTAALAYLAGTAEPEPDHVIVLRILAERLSSSRPAWADRGAYEALGEPYSDVPGGPRLARHGYRDQLDGLRDETWLYVYPATWDRIIADAGVTGPLVLRGLYDAGYLGVSPSVAARKEWRSVAPRWAGQVPVIKIRLTALDGPALDGPALDGPALDGPALDGPALDGPALDGPALDGPALDGPAAEYDPWEAERASMAALWQEPATAADPEPRAPEPAIPATAADPRQEWLNAAWRRNLKHFKTREQRDALDRITRLLDENPDPDDKEALVSLTDRLEFANELEGRGKDWGGPFLPSLRHRAAKLHPWSKKDGLPLAAEMAVIIEGYGFSRPEYRGPLTVADRNGAWIGSIGNAKIALGPLDPGGEMSMRDAKDLAGYAKIRVAEWREKVMPSPTGHAKPGTEIWVPTELISLLYYLSEQDRWPYEDVLETMASRDVIRLEGWGRLAGEQRRYALETYGYGSGAYRVTKDAVSKAISLMAGTMAEDTAMPRRVWTKGKCHRPDGRHQIITNSAVHMWRTADRCMMMAGGDPALMPAGIRAKDELLIPDAALEMFTTRNYPGGTRPPVRIDQTGIELGTFKIKGREQQ